MNNQDLPIIAGCRICCRLPNGELKGSQWFINSDGKQCVATVIDDKTYVSEFPFETYEEVMI